MGKENEFSRRSLQAATGGLAFASRLAAATNDDREKLPIIPQRVEKVFKTPASRSRMISSLPPTATYGFSTRLIPTKFSR